jgi:hypothetical protein
MGCCWGTIVKYQIVNHKFRPAGIGAQLNLSVGF